MSTSTAVTTPPDFKRFQEVACGNCGGEGWGIGLDHTGRERSYMCGECNGTGIVLEPVNEEATTTPQPQ